MLECRVKRKRGKLRAAARCRLSGDREKDGKVSTTISLLSPRRGKKGVKGRSGEESLYSLQAQALKGEGTDTRSKAGGGSSLLWSFKEEKKECKPEWITKGKE